MSQESNCNKESKLNIIYSVCGEGMGHATRSAVIIEELQKNYNLLIFSSDRAYEYLSTKFDNVYEISGFNTVYENNKVKNLETLIKNVKTLPKDFKDSVNLLTEKSTDFKPNIIITDFEPYVSVLSYFFNIPMISLDNIHILSESKLDYPKKYSIEKIKAEAVIKSTFLKKPNRYMITSFFYPKLKNPEKTKLYHPILRNEILSLKSEFEDYILVYQTSDSNNKLIEILKKVDENFIVYGFRKEEVDGNIKFMNFNEDQFYQDISKAKAVIANGGFTFITESLYLKKPIMSIPARGNFEQINNGIYVDKLNYGMMCKKITLKSLNNFLNNLEDYKESLKNYSSKDNKKVIEDLKENIEKYSKDFSDKKTNKMKTFEKFR